MDNDGNVDALKQKYEDYLGKMKVDNINIFFDTDKDYTTLEPQMLKANSLTLLNTILGKTFNREENLLNYMRNNKTDTALKVFNSDDDLVFPKYINDAIEK